MSQALAASLVSNFGGKPSGEGTEFGSILKAVGYIERWSMSPEKEQR
jgi:hypothetical protein